MGSGGVPGGAADPVVERDPIQLRICGTVPEDDVRITAAGKGFGGCHQPGVIEPESGGIVGRDGGEVC